jgi:PAS domain S-box-containing protein
MVPPVDCASMPVGVVVHNADGTIIWSNPAARSVLGLSLDEITGRTSCDPRWHAVRPDGTPFPGEEHPAMEALRTGRSVESVIMGVHHPLENRTRWIQVSAAPIFLDDESQPHHVVASFLDVSARKQADDELRQREARLNRAESVARFGHWELDLQKRTMRGSHGAGRIYGLPGHLWDLATAQAVPLPEFRPALDAALAGLVERGETYDIEFAIRRPVDGALRHVHSTAEYDQARHVVFGVVRDITERKLAEDALTRQTAFVRAVFDADDAHMAVIDPDGTILEVNAAWRRFARANGGGDRSVCDVGANYFRQCIAGGDRTSAEDAYAGIRQVQRGDLPLFEIVYPCHSPDQERWFVLRAMPMEGRPGTVLVSHRNETDRVRAELALRASEERFEKAFRSSPVLMTLTELESGRLVEVNDWFCQVSGTSRQEAVGHTLDELGWTMEIDRRTIVDSLLAHGRITNLELRFSSRSGREIVCMLSCEVLDFNGHRCLLGVAADVTEAKRTEEQRRLLESQVQHLHRMESVGRLAGGVAHDMNNVLTAILGFAELEHEMAVEGTPLHAHMQTITKACLRGRTMLRGLLDFAREGLANEQLLDLNAVVRDEMALLERTTMQAVTLCAELDGNLPAVRGDAVALAHLLMNLCLNAIDAMPNGGELVVRTGRREGEQVLLEVVDNGCGMAPEVLDKALDPFFTTKAQGKGTGLGLAIAYRTVAAHRGSMRISSAPGAGTTVSILLPADTAGVGEAGPSEAAPGVAHRVLKVLVVDDDELVQQSTCDLVRALGHAAVGVSRGEGALAKLEAGERFDVVVLDINMPGLGGVATLPRLRALRPALPVLLSTGRLDQVATDLVETVPGVKLLPKPFRMADLKAHFAQID